MDTPPFAMGEAMEEKNRAPAGSGGGSARSWRVTALRSCRNRPDPFGGAAHLAHETTRDTHGCRDHSTAPPSRQLLISPAADLDEPRVGPAARGPGVGPVDPLAAGRVVV